MTTATTAVSTQREPELLGRPSRRRRAVERRPTRLRAQPGCTGSRGGDADAPGRVRVTQSASWEVMALVVSGLLNKQVAAELGINEITVTGKV